MNNGIGGSQNSLVPIQPSERVKTTTITGFQVRVVNVNLFTSVSVSVQLFNNDTLVDNQFLEISGADYDLWTNNDQTLIDLVAQKLGFVIEPTA
jgi:hypothetical protein